MNKILTILILGMIITMNVHAEKDPICWRNAQTNERELFNPYASAEKMREFVRPQTEEVLSLYDAFITQGYTPLQSLKGVLNYMAQKNVEKIPRNQRQ